MSKNIWILFICFLSLPALALARRVPNEKIYLLLDKKTVQPGDTLGVSGLVLEAYDFSRPYSRYVHIELIDKRDSVIARQKLNCGGRGYSAPVCR